MQKKKIKAKAVAKAALGKKKKGKELTAKEEKFCQIFSSDREFFCNGVQSYIEAYNIPARKYNSAQVLSSRLLGKVIIQKRIAELIEIDGLNDESVDKQLAKVVIQDYNLPAKVQGIREYNTLKKRTTKKELDITSGGKPITGMRIVKA